MQEIQIEHLLLANLLQNREYVFSAYPFLKKEYFETEPQKIVFRIFSEFYDKFTELPDSQIISVCIKKQKKLPEETIKESLELLEKVSQKSCLKEDKSLEWLLEKTEEWCRDQAFTNSLRFAIDSLDHKDKRVEARDLIRDALAISFDKSLGHDFLEDSEERYDENNIRKKSVPTDISLLNKVTDGGFPVKTLNIFMGHTYAGKTVFLCHFAASQLLKGYNVLYLTFEMSATNIGKRIDSNVLGVPIKEVYKCSKEIYTKRIETLQKKKLGKLIIKEYGSGTTSISQIHSFVNEMRMKNGFVPDAIYVDYLSIVGKPDKGQMKQAYLSNLAVEMRSLAQELEIPIVTAVQTNRDGYASSDISARDIADCYDVVNTSDFFAAIIRTDALKELGQVMVKQIKNRHTDANLFSKFVVGMDTDTMRLYDVSQDFITGGEKPKEDYNKMDDSPFGKTFNDKKEKNFAKYKGIKI